MIKHLLVQGIIQWLVGKGLCVISPFQSSMLNIRSLVWGSEPGDGQVARLGHGDWENSFQTPKGEGT